MDYAKKKRIITGIVVVSILGTIFHFAYEFLGKIWIAGIIFPVNESTFEHMKLVYYPMMLYGFYLNCKTNNDEKSLEQKYSYAMIFGTWCVPVLYYSYMGILGFLRVQFSMNIYLCILRIECSCCKIISI